jgi:3-hydroxyisobutyrate dehydrogenase
MRAGFIGLGNMGRPMAKNVLKANFELVVHNRSRPPVDELVAAGAAAAGSPHQVAAQCDVVLTCVPGPADVEQVILGENGALAGARAGTVFVDHSTIDPTTARRIAAACAGRGVHFLDAPVSGGTTGAAEASLTIMVGGERAAFDRVRPVLEAEGKNIHYLGPSGVGCIVKLVNQLLVGVHLAVLAEAMVLGTRAGADPQAVYEVLRTSFGASRMMDRSVPNFILKGNFQPGFSVNLLLKDLGLVLGLGRELSVPLRQVALAQQAFIEAQAHGLGLADVSAIIRPLEELAGVEVRAHRSTYDSESRG